MPYILEERRKLFDESLKNCADKCESAGDLCYCFYKIICYFIKRNGLSFDNWTKCVSALESTKLEFYRAYMEDYEDKKIRDNGDIIL